MSYPQLCSEFRVSLDCMRSCLKEEKQGERKKSRDRGEETLLGWQTTVVSSEAQ